MSIYVVSDLHGAPAALPDAVPRGATLLLLGDLINFLDYSTMEGILTEVFPVETVSEVVRLRTAGLAEEARRVMRARSAGRENEVRGEIARRVRGQYEQVFAALPPPCFVILGNVDNPAIAGDLLARAEDVHDADGKVLVLEGQRFGFVGGGLPTPMKVAGEITDEKMADKAGGLGEVDFLCSHVPPAVPELCFDTIARMPARGSKSLLAYIRDVQPRRAYFGHVHQPLVSSMYIGNTLCINVGYFRATRRAFPHWCGG